MTRKNINVIVHIQWIIPANCLCRIAALDPEAEAA